MERLLRVPEAAARIALSRTTTYELILSGALPSVTIGRTRRIREADLDAFIRRQAEQAPTPIA
jgi:excisionase family DNA binding protein